ncbi:MAG: HAMP domain-containing histidine kinase [Propionibacteriaceae bacterium]|nr:HAMP domain-containing histidine kinase [Propionibacteriaceae bacterium]
MSDELRPHRSRRAAGEVVRPEAPGPARGRRNRAARASGQGRAGERRQRERSRNDPIWYIQLRNLLLGVAALSAGWWLAGWIFSLTGRPPELVVYLASIALGIALAGGVAVVIGRLTGAFNDDPGRVLTDLGEALDRIARGDFSVRLNSPTNGRSPTNGLLADLVASVNNMAAGLGNVEQQRQEFISNVSHEIQSPLTSIGGFASLLRDGDLDEATRQHYLDVISAEVSRLSKLSDNLLRLSALDSSDDVDRQPLRLDEQLRSVVLLLEPQWTAKRLDVQLDTVPVEFDADADMLRQVWMNLLSNAVKYTPDGGSIRVGVVASAGQVKVVIADTGIGIGPDDLPRVFERFFRADKARSGDGNGLGLSLVKRVVELHGGEVTVASQLDQGSTFTVTLPLKG